MSGASFVDQLVSAGRSSASLTHLCDVCVCWKLSTARGRFFSFGFSYQTSSIMNITLIVLVSASALFIAMFMSNECRRFSPECFVGLP